MNRRQILLQSVLIDMIYAQQLLLTAKIIPKMLFIREGFWGFYQYTALPGHSYPGTAKDGYSYPDESCGISRQQIRQAAKKEYPGCIFIPEWTASQVQKDFLPKILTPLSWNSGTVYEIRSSETGVIESLDIIRRD